MKTKAKKLLITTEKHEIFIIHPGAVPAVFGFCPTCAEEVEVLTLDSAVIVSGLSGLQIVRQVSNNRTHSIETVNGHLLLCRKSLVATLLEEFPVT